LIKEADFYQPWPAPFGDRFSWCIHC